MFKVIILSAAEKDLEKMDKFEARKVIVFLSNNIENCENPKYLGRPLRELDPLTWRYRIGKMRVLCELDYEKQFVYVHAVLSRDKAYK